MHPGHPWEILALQPLPHQNVDAGNRNQPKCLIQLSMLSSLAESNTNWKTPAYNWSCVFALTKLTNASSMIYASESF
jgi:hypothetical protein